MGLWDKVKESLSDTSKGAPPARFTAAGKPIVCDHCGHDAFHEGSALLNSVSMTLVDLDWADDEATTLMCDECGRIQWYGIKPTRSV